MSGWIKIEKDLESDPRIRRIARDLRNAYVTHESISAVTHLFSPAFFVAVALGGLGRLWIYADTHIRDDDTIEVGIEDINQIVGIEGFAQILPADWLQVLDTETVKLPDFHGHNGTKARKRALTQKRVSKHRERVTLEALHSDSKGNAHVTPRALPDQDQDQDQDHKKPAARGRAGKSIPGEFMDFKIAYPSRAGDPGWRKAIKAANARLSEGYTWTEMIDGAKRYAAYIRSTGNENTEYVKQAGTFLGPDKHFLLSWDAPAAKLNGARNAASPAAKAWQALISSKGAKRDARAQAALEKIGGWQRVQLRTDRDAPFIEREFCQAYVEAAA